MSPQFSRAAGHAVVVTARGRAELLPAEDAGGELGPGEVAGRTVASLVSAGTELNGSFLGEQFPSRPGYAAVFEVEEVGPGVERVRRGDLAFCAGKHRSFQREPQERVLRVPPGLEGEVAVFARMMGVSMTTLVTTRARPPARVLVTGLGLVGHLAAKVFASCGYEVTGVDPNPRRRDLALRAGLGDVREAVPLEDPTLRDTVALVLECSGHEGAALEGCRLVRERGEVVLVGAPWRARTSLLAHDLLHAVFHRYVTLRSGWEWELPFMEGRFANTVSGARVGASIMGNLEAAMRWLAEGRVKVGGLAETAPPSQAQAVYERLLNDPDAPLTVVFDWSAPGG